MNTIAVYPGTFDPFTLGHLDIANRIASIFPRVIILVANNPSKKPMFSVGEREQIIAQVIGDAWSKDTMVASHSGLLVDYVKELAKQGNTPVVIRGLRAMSDFENEFQMAHVNRTLFVYMDTMFIPTSSEYFFVSSSTVREVFNLGGDVSKFVHPKTLEFMKKKFYSKAIRKIPGVEVHDTASWCHTCNPGLKKD